MKRMFLVLSLVLASALTSFAAKPTNYGFYLRDTAGNAYCDGFQLQLYSPGAGIPKAVVGGYHFDYDCVGSIASVGGFLHGISPKFQYAALGNVLDVSDPTLALTGSNASLSWLINTKYSTWIVYSGNDFFGNYVINYGTFVNGSVKQGSAPAKNGATKPAYRP
jgi:hypothetical protein